MIDKRLIAAIHGGDLEAVHQLITLGVEINSRDPFQGHSPLHLAAQEAKFDIVKLLISHRAKVNARDGCNLTPFNYAITKYDTEVYKSFVDAGVDVNSVGKWDYTALHMAVNQDDLLMTKYLLSHGANPNAKDDSGQTPVHFACSPYAIRDLNKNMVKCLLEHNACMDAYEKRGRTPLLYFLQNVKSSSQPVKELETFLRFLLKYSDINMVDSNKNNVATSIEVNGLMEVVLEHLAKLQILDMHIEPVILNNILKVSSYQDYFGKCKKELLEAKRTKLKDSWVSFFNLLVDNQRRLKNYAGNQDLVGDFKNSNCVQKFPIYGVYMQKNMKKGMQRRVLYDESSIVLSKCLPVFDPFHLVVRDILDCLSTEDMSKLFEDYAAFLLSFVSL